MAVVVIAFSGRFLDRPIHPFCLTVGPGMIGFGQAVLNAVFPAGAVKGVTTKARCRTIGVLRQIGKLDAVIGQYGVDRTSHIIYRRPQRGDF